MTESIPAWIRVLRHVEFVPSSSEVKGDCWIFTGANNHGYGRIQMKKGMLRQSHRVVYEALVAPIPDGFEPDHLCEHKACCNPFHLESVTHHVNLLRGKSPVAIHAHKTHCIRNHEFNEENTYRYKGGRYCRACRKERRTA